MKNGLKFSCAAVLTLVGSLAGCAEDPACEGDACSAPSAEPPTPAEKAPAASGVGVTTFAARSFSFGALGPDAWKDIGFDLDGQQAPSCARGDELGSAEFGHRGIDNGFGAHLVPGIEAVSGPPDALVTDHVARGDYTLLFSLTGVGDGADYSGVWARVYEAAPLGRAPTFDGSDVWPIAFESAVEPSVFDAGYVKNRVWVSGPSGRMPLRLMLGGGADQDTLLDLSIENAVVTLELDADAHGERRGTIAGTIRLSELVPEAQRFVGSISADDGTCDPKFLKSVADVVTGSADLLSTLHVEPAVECDAVSIGVAFVATPAVAGDVAPARAPKIDLCPE